MLEQQGKICDVALCLILSYTDDISTYMNTQIIIVKNKEFGKIKVQDLSIYQIYEKEEVNMPSTFLT